MLDSVGLERRGIPSVVIVHDLFESAARAQLAASGIPDLPVIATPRPRQGSEFEEMLEHDPDLVERVMAALEARMTLFATEAAG
jgi:hypothetical protein